MTAHTTKFDLLLLKSRLETASDEAKTIEIADIHIGGGEAAVREGVEQLQTLLNKSITLISNLLS